MKCPTCNGRMTLLFVSAVCEWCSARPCSEPNRGWITWRGRPAGSVEYVFKTPGDAERWRDSAGLNRFPIRSVIAAVPFHWRASTGYVRDIMLADRLFEVFTEPTTREHGVYLEPA